MTHCKKLFGIKGDCVFVRSSLCSLCGLPDVGSIARLSYFDHATETGDGGDLSGDGHFV